MLRRQRRLDGLYGFYNEVMGESLGETLEKFAGYFANALERKQRETEAAARGACEGDPRGQARD